MGHTDARYGRLSDFFGGGGGGASLSHLAAHTAARGFHLGFDWRAPRVCVCVVVVGALKTGRMRKDCMAQRPTPNTEYCEGWGHTLT